MKLAWGTNTGTTPSDDGGQVIHTRHFLAKFRWWRASFRSMSSNIRTCSLFQRKGIFNSYGFGMIEGPAPVSPMIGHGRTRRENSCRCAGHGVHSDGGRVYGRFVSVFLCSVMRRSNLGSWSLHARVERGVGPLAGPRKNRHLPRVSSTETVLIFFSGRRSQHSGPDTG